MANERLQSLYASQYTDGEWQGPGWYQRLKPFIQTREEVVAQCVPEHTQNLVDLGCGEGLLFPLVEKKVQSFTGVDLLESRLKIARKRFQKKSASKVQFIQADLDEKLPFSDKSVDVVTVISALEYVLVPDKLLQEIQRVLRPGGVCIIEVPNLAYILERFRLLRGELVGSAHAPGWQGGRLHHFTQASLRNLLRDHAFSVEKVGGSGFLSSVRSVWPSLLSADLVMVARKK